MIEQIEELKDRAVNDSKSIASADALEKFRLAYLSRNGSLSGLFEEFKHVDKESKGAVGKKLNELKQLIQNIYDERKSSLESESGMKDDDIDLSLPGRIYNAGTKNLLNQALDEIVSIFEKIGFNVYEGPEIEDEYHNFDALNTPAHHPSRDMQDTFYIDSKGRDRQYLLRTHTSPGQIRIMETSKPPIRLIVPGKCYRNEAVSSRTLAMFHQVEGIYVDRNVTFSELKGTIEYFAREFFGEKLKIRMRPSFFPFTEPSAEVDVECYLCGGKGCKVCKHTGWLEIVGCGMVDPNVFGYVGYDPEVYTGFAFGMGIERTLMNKFRIPDIRMLYENDIRFLKQF